MKKAFLLTLITALFISMAFIGSVFNESKKPAPANPDQVTPESKELQVKVWEGEVIIPTYEIAPEDINPSFPATSNFEVYPYPLNIYLTHKLDNNKKYKAVFLENEYLRLTLLPDLGGRIFSAYDLVNKCELFYKNNVVKPGLLGLRGAWISGGVEFNFPYGHTVTTVSPIDYTLRNNPDHSASVIISNIEMVSRMKWEFILTLHPKRSYIEQGVRFFNRTETRHRFYYWANAATTANENVQLILPATYTTPHEKDKLVKWPMDDGIDLSWHKVHPGPRSVFALGCKEDFFGSYDHKLKYGMLHTADYHEAPGKKFWTWGNGHEADIWTEILTDTDGNYNEVQTGRLETQSDFQFLEPQTAVFWNQYWYPIKDIPGVSNANKNGAMYLKKSADKMELTILPTVNIKDAKIEVKEVNNNNVVWQQKVTLEPLIPANFIITGVTEAMIKLYQAGIYNSSGVLVLQFTEKVKMDEPESALQIPVTQKKKEEMNADDLYLMGLIMERRDNSGRGGQLPKDLYFEALKKDPNHVQARTALGILYYNEGSFQKAIDLFSQSIKWDKDNAMAMYHQGLALKRMGKNKEAEEMFWLAANYADYYSLGHYFIGELEMAEGNYARAADHFSKSLDKNVYNTRAMGLMAVALRKQGKAEETKRIIELVLKIDPTDFLALWEKSTPYLLKSTEPSTLQIDELRRIMRDNPQSYIELSLDYANAGLFADALDVLEQYDRWVQHKHISPMIIYYTSYYQRHSNFMADYDMPSPGSMDYIFPHRLEDIEVLNDSIVCNPKDSLAYYYLGNVLFGKGRLEEGIKAWEKSAELGETYSVLHRNLGMAYHKINNDLPKAVIEYNKALDNNAKDTTTYLELGAIYRELGKKDDEFALWQRCNKEGAMQGGESKSRLADLYLQFGKLDEALDFLNSNYFDNWELSGGTHQVYENILIRRGDEKFLTGDMAGASKDYYAATQYPKNLGVGEPPAWRRSLATVYYRLAVSYEKLNKKPEADKCWQEIIKERPAVLSFGKYAQAIAYQKLDKADESKAVLDEMVKAIPADYKDKPKKDMVNYYFMGGLIAKAQGEMDKAKESFNVVLEITTGHADVVFELGLMK